MHTATVIKRLKRYQPTTAQEILDKCELPLQYVGGGAFRDVYHVIGTSVVIKVPRKTDKEHRTEKRIQHSRDEFSIWTRMKNSKRKFRAFAKYLPELIYYNSHTGIIVMRKYEKVRYNKVNNSFANELEEMITKVMGTCDADIHNGNLGFDKRGNIKIIDMGLFIAGKV